MGGAYDSQPRRSLLTKNYFSKPMRNPAGDSRLRTRAKPRNGLTTRGTCKSLRMSRNSYGARKIIFTSLFPPHYSQKRFEQRTASPTILKPLESLYPKDYQRFFVVNISHYKKAINHQKLYYLTRYLGTF